jgi:hypothetical protein
MKNYVTFSKISGIAQNATHALPPLPVVNAKYNFQLEPIVLQSDTELKQNFISMKLVEFLGWFSESKFGNLKGVCNGDVQVLTST